MESCYSCTYMIVYSGSAWVYSTFCCVHVCCYLYSCFSFLHRVYPSHTRSIAASCEPTVVAIEPRIAAIEQNALLSVPQSPAPLYASSFHDDMGIYSPLTRQATPFSSPPVPMLPPAQPGPSYKPVPNTSSQKFASPAAASSQHISSLNLPVSPTKLTLKPVDIVIRHNSKLLKPHRDRETGYCPCT